MKEKLNKLFSKEMKVKLALVGVGIVTGAVVTTVVIYKFPPILGALPNIQIEKAATEVAEVVATAA